MMILTIVGEYFAGNFDEHFLLLKGSVFSISDYIQESVINL